VGYCVFKHNKDKVFGSEKREKASNDRAYTLIWKAVSCFSRRLLIACLHDQNKSGFFGGPAFI